MALNLVAAAAQVTKKTAAAAVRGSWEPPSALPLPPLHLHAPLFPFNAPCSVNGTVMQLASHAAAVHAW
jgi:hypothetical protein